MIALTRAWMFTLYPERRNKALWDLIGFDYHDHKQIERWDYADQLPDPLPPNLIGKPHEYNFHYGRDGKPKVSYGLRLLLQAESTKAYGFDKGTILEVDRIYIRQGNPKFSSVTFKTLIPGPKSKMKTLRFWVKLADANQVCFTYV
jgi:hypothetical protein